jgi:methylated-DNA-[protein]-cysteine S-methyltransferase
MPFDNDAVGLDELKELVLEESGEQSRRMAEGFAARAVDDGLADVTYGFAESPFGPLLVAITRRGLVKLDYPERDFDQELETIAARISPRILHSSKSTEEVRRQLDEYFDGQRRKFDVPVDLSLSNGFSRRVLSATARIPFGSVATYRDVATSAGNVKATRAAGNALGSNPVPIVVPCHRVVRTGGGLGGYTGGLARKVALLRLEGALDPEDVVRT